MKIHIFYKFKDGPWGGGNQFLKALKSEFIKNDLYANSVRKADVIIFDSYQNVIHLIWRWLIYNKKLVYRLGPVFHLHRRGIKWKLVDKIVILIANLCTNLVIFQSEWSYQQALKLDFSQRKKYAIIANAVDTSIFFRKVAGRTDASKPVRLIYTSWSSNPNKGFSYLKFLDDNLDFNKYQMVFIGNSSVQFKNIKITARLSSIKLADELRNSDVFVSPVKNDACSNAILEALACGLPVVALESGGNGELVRQGGKLFKNESELIQCIEEVSSNLESFQNKISIKSIEDIAKEYISAISTVCGNIKNNG